VSGFDISHNTIYLTLFFSFISFLQIAESSVPGVFNVFSMVNNELHTIKVNVPRIFYVNSKKMKEGEGASMFLIFLKF